MATIQLKQFRGSDRRLMESFVRFPRRLYHQDKYWVPEWLPERRHFHDPRHNVELRHIDVTYFLAYRDGEPLGRICAHVNHRHRDVTGDRVGFFGMFECEDDQGAANALFDAAAAMLGKAGCDTIRGPANFSSNGEWGMLVDGRYEESPYVLTNYAPRYYAWLCERAEFHSAMDLRAYDFSNWQWPHPRIQRAAQRAEKQGITVRSIRSDARGWRADFHTIRQIVNASFSSQWGFLPWDDSEEAFMAEEWRQIVHPQFGFIVEHSATSRPVGFALGLPDMNQILIHTRARTLALAWQIFVRRSQFRFGEICNRLRVPMIGVLPGFQRRGVDAVLVDAMFRHAMQAGLLTAEASLVPADNAPLNRLLVALGGRVSKVFRVWQRPISAAAAAAEPSAEDKSAAADVSPDF